jgi:hypothetical protein
MRNRRDGPTLTTPATNDGSGIVITGNNASTSISNVIVNGMSKAGIYTSGDRVNLSNVTLTDNGLNATAGTLRSGLVVAGGVVRAQGGWWGGVGGTQQYGVYLNVDGQFLNGVDLSGNSTAGLGAAGALTTTDLRGCKGANDRAGGSTSIASDASGLVQVVHGLWRTPSSAQATVSSSSNPWVMTVAGFNSTVVTFKVWNPTTGTAVASTTIPFLWSAQT